MPKYLMNLVIRTNKWYFFASVDYNSRMNGNGNVDHWHNFLTKGILEIPGIVKIGAIHGLLI